MEGAAFFLLVGFVIWLAVTRKNKRDTQRHEKTMAMIEKGIYEPLPEPEPAYRTERYLLAGIVLLLIGAVLSGVGVALLIYFALSFGNHEFFLAGLVLLFPGLTFIGFYRFLLRKGQREEKGNVLQANQPS